MLAMKHVMRTLPNDKMRKEAALLLERLRGTVLCDLPQRDQHPSEEELGATDESQP